MKKILFISTLAVVVFFQSCLMTPCLLRHYFEPVNSAITEAPKIMIFSTPKQKEYIITPIRKGTQIFIKSPVFENPEKFYLAVDRTSAEEPTKEYILEKRDRKFYKARFYKTITLKISDHGNEKIIEYKLAKE